MAMDDSEAASMLKALMKPSDGKRGGLLDSLATVALLSPAADAALPAARSLFMLNNRADPRNGRPRSASDSDTYAMRAIAGRSPLASVARMNSPKSVGDQSMQYETGVLPHMMSKYAGIYNKNGRIGIYTPEERKAIIRRFHEKRQRRVWSKKIRYNCRKTLADKRKRVKGRFVKKEELQRMEQELKEKEKDDSEGAATESVTSEDTGDETAEAGAAEEVEPGAKRVKADEGTAAAPLGAGTLARDLRFRRHSIAF